MNRIDRATEAKYYRTLSFAIVGQVKMMKDRGYTLTKNMPISDEEVLELMENRKVDSSLFARRTGGTRASRLPNGHLDCDYENEIGHTILVRWIDDNIVDNVLRKNTPDQIARLQSDIVRSSSAITMARESSANYDHLKDDSITGRHRYGNMNRYVSCICIGWSKLSQANINTTVKMSSIHVEYFSQSELIICPVDHVDYDPHTLLNLDETKTVMSQLGIDIEQSPKIYNTDAIVKYLGCSENYGQMIRIDKNYYFLNSLVNSWITYRLIVKKDYSAKKR